MSNRVDLWLTAVMVVAGTVLLIDAVVDHSLWRSCAFLAVVLFYGWQLRRARRPPRPTEAPPAWPGRTRD